MACTSVWLLYVAKGTQPVRCRYATPHTYAGGIVEALPLLHVPAFPHCCSVQLPPVHVPYGGVSSLAEGQGACHLLPASSVDMPNSQASSLL